MTEVSIRDLRNEGGSVIERVLRGELITVTKSGVPVAELRPVTPGPVPGPLLLQRWRGLPRVDFDSLRSDIDGLLDMGL